jgi:hypothetical protein
MKGKCHMKLTSIRFSQGRSQPGFILTADSGLPRITVLAENERPLRIMSVADGRHHWGDYFAPLQVSTKVRVARGAL